MNAKLCKPFVLAVIGLPLLLVALTGCQTGTPMTVEGPRSYSFWPPAPDAPRVQFLIAFNSSADVTPAQSKMDEMMYGRPQILGISKAYGVAMWQGKIYVCDVRSRGITVLDLRQHFAKAVGVGGTMEIAKAVDIAIAPDGSKYVVDQQGKAIVVLDPEDKTVARLAPKDLTPVSVAVYGDELFVVDYAAQIVKVLKRTTGEVVRTIGEKGSENGQFVRPLTVRIDPSGVVFVSDVITCRVQRFSRDGKFLSSFAQVGNLPGDLVRPKHFSFDKNGFMYIADGGFANVQVFDDQQKVVGYFGSAGSHPGAMDLPVGVFVDESPEDLALFRRYVHPAFEAERLVLVTNQFGNQRVSVFALGHLKPGKTVADIAASRGKVSAGTQAPTTGPVTQPIFTPGTLIPQDDGPRIPATLP